MTILKYRKMCFKDVNTSKATQNQVQWEGCSVSVEPLGFIIRTNQFHPWGQKLNIKTFLQCLPQLFLWPWRWRWHVLPEHHLIFNGLHGAMGARGSVVGWGTMLQTGRSPVQVLDKVDFFQSFQPHYGPGVDSASNRNEYQESSWG
jgi:hypothetical protein